MNWQWLCAAGVSGVASLCLFTASSQQVPRATEYTAQLIRATGGRQVFELGPAPYAGLISAIGGLAGITSIGCLLKGLDWESVGDFEPEQFPGGFPPPSAPRPLARPNSSHESIAAPPSHITGPFGVRLPVPSRPKEPTIPDGFLNFGDLAPVAGAGLLFLIGGKGGGKTTLAAAIVRDRLMRGHQVVILNHHYAFGDYNPLQVYGKGETIRTQFADIEKGLNWFLAERESRYRTRQLKPKEEWDFESQPITILIEELGEYKGSVDPELMDVVTRAIVTGTRKANIYVILVSQGETISLLGGAAGFSAALKSDGCFVKVQNQPDPSRIGGLGPTGYALMSVNGGQEKQVKVPDFSGLFPNDKIDFSDLFEGEVSQENEPEPAQIVVPDDREILNQIYSRPSVTPSHEQSVYEPLPIRLKAILDYARRLGSPVTARIVQQQKIKGTEGMNADDFRAAFDELADKNMGQTGGDGANKWFIAD